MRLGTLLTLIGLLGWASPAAAGLYQCKNADGSVRYQQTPCSAGMQGTRLETRSPGEAPTLSTTPTTTWGDVRRAKSECDEVARRTYPGDDARRNRNRVSCMERVERACKGENRKSSRCRRAVRNMGNNAKRVRTKASRRSAAGGDAELMGAKATCHAWSTAEPSHRTRTMRGQACQALASACGADRQGPDCRERIRQLRPR